MKKKIEVINKEEELLKKEIEDIVHEKDKSKARAKEIKELIKTNRKKYLKSEEQFGTDAELNINAVIPGEEGDGDDDEDEDEDKD